MNTDISVSIVPEISLKTWDPYQDSRLEEEADSPVEIEITGEGNDGDTSSRGSESM